MKKRSYVSVVESMQQTYQKKVKIVSKSHHLSSLIIMDTHQHNFQIDRKQTLCFLRDIY